MEQKVKNIKNLYITKSFCCLGESLDKCFGCKYCRAEPLSTNNIYNTLPEKINPIFSNMPIVINIFYGDPLLQVEKTKNYLKQLEEVDHKGIVLIITKGKITDLGDLNYNLDIHIALSTIGLTHSVDKVGYKNFLYNLNHLNDYNVKYSCEFRPIMYGINSNEEVIDNLFKLCSQHNLPIGYCGLQASEDLKQYWNDNNIIDFKPFPDYELCVKKPISEECENIINKYSKKYNVPIFKKTSCLLSYVHNLGRDYNAHYYRPNELDCKDCVMFNNCMDFKSKQNDLVDFSELIPFKHIIKKVEGYKCSYYNMCKFPHNDCTNISGYVIHIDKQITSADLRVIKWLTGYTVKSSFVESAELSKEWMK